MAVYGWDSLSDWAWVPRVGWRPVDEPRHGGLPVTLRVRQVCQPRGGWLPPRLFSRVPLSDPMRLHARENRSPADVGLAVDYLTRLMCSGDARGSFGYSLAGADLVGARAESERLLARIDGLSDGSVRAALDLVRFDQVVRRGPGSVDPSRTPPRADPDTCWNVRRMVQRSCRFLDAFGPVEWDGFTFEGGYTPVVSYGDGDFMTADTLWDMKTLRGEPTRDHTLQLLCYWLMGTHSVHPEYRRVRRLGLYNPRLDVVYLCSVASLPWPLLRKVCVGVIGYEDRWRFMD